MLGLLPSPALHAMGGAPFLTDDPGTPGDGHWEVNVACTHTRREGECDSELPLFDINYGLGERLELNFAVANVIGHEDGTGLKQGLSNSQAAVKWRYYDDEKSGLTMSVTPQVEFRNPGSNSARRGLADDETTFVLPFEFQREVGGWGVDVEVGAILPSKSDHGWLYGIMVGRSVTDRVDLGIELHGEGSSRLDQTQLAVNVGARFKLSEHFAFHLALGRDLHNHFEPRATFSSYVAIQWTR